MRRVWVLVGFGVGLWLALLGPAWWWYGELALLHSAVGLVLTLLPAVATMLWANTAWKNSPDMHPLVVLGGSGVRIAVALGIGTYLYFEHQETFSAVFLGWIVVFYLVLLAVEIALVVQPSGAMVSDKK